jgi:hypothetical protein
MSMPNLFDEYGSIHWVNNAPDEPDLGINASSPLFTGDGLDFDLDNSSSSQPVTQTTSEPWSSFTGLELNGSAFGVPRQVPLTSLYNLFGEGSARVESALLATDFTSSIQDL